MNRRIHATYTFSVRRLKWRARTAARTRSSRRGGGSGMVGEDRRTPASATRVSGERHEVRLTTLGDDLEQRPVRPRRRHLADHYRLHLPRRTQRGHRRRRALWRQREEQAPGGLRVEEDVGGGGPRRG